MDGTKMFLLVKWKLEFKTLIGKQQIIFMSETGRVKTNIFAKTVAILIYSSTCLFLICMRITYKNFTTDRLHLQLLNACHLT